MYLVGLDLGQSKDYSALCVIERTHVQASQPPLRLEPHFAVRHLTRWPLGASYPAIVTDVVALLDRAPLARPTTPLVVDQTGVGRAVCDLFNVGGVRPRGVTITGGLAANLTDPFNVTVPKRMIVSTLVAYFQTGRLKIAEGLDLASVLITELANFKLKINLETGNDSFEAWRESIHDDLVLAVGLAVWLGTIVQTAPSQSIGDGTQLAPDRFEGRDTAAVRALPFGGYRPLG